MSDTEQDKTEAVLDTRPKPFVFVLMPFGPAFTDVYQLGIKRACEQAGAYAQRLDEQLFDESMLERIYNQIAKADVIVADMTGRNPNVFYEVGYAHALGKVVVLLAQKDEDIPFDLKHYRHIIYENVTGLLPPLETAIRWAIKQASGRAVSPKPPIALYCSDMPLVNNPTIAIFLAGGRAGRVPLRLTYGNADEVNGNTFIIALWTSVRFCRTIWEIQEERSREVVVLPILHPDGMCVFNSPAAISLLPGEWGTCKIVLSTADGAQMGIGAAESVMLRVSTASGSYSYPFTIRASKSPEAPA